MSVSFLHLIHQGDQESCILIAPIRMSQCDSSTVYVELIFIKSHFLAHCYKTVLQRLRWLR